jgi:hypothetical protein
MSNEYQEDDSFTSLEDEMEQDVADLNEFQNEHEEEQENENQGEGVEHENLEEIQNEIQSALPEEGVQEQHHGHRSNELNSSNLDSNQGNSEDDLSSLDPLHAPSTMEVTPTEPIPEVPKPTGPVTLLTKQGLPIVVPPGPEEPCRTLYVRNLPERKGHTSTFF